jgi:hypothetical protein
MSVSTGSSTTDVDAGAENEAPQLSALFLIRFDKKIGYVIFNLDDSFVRADACYLQLHNRLET